jgi:hypothetical protein
MIQLLPLIIIIINIFPLPKLLSSHTNFFIKVVYDSIKILFLKGMPI